MNYPKSDGDSASFIVRIWKETSDHDEDAVHWRGVIERVGQQQQIYFQELSAISRYISEQMHIKEEGSLAGFWKKSWKHPYPRKSKP